MKISPLKDLLNLMFPNICHVCGALLTGNETYLCLSCLYNIPKTNYHTEPDNPVEKRFWGKVQLLRGTSYFLFQKGSPFQKILHNIKYKGDKELGYMLGKHAAFDLLDSIDFISVDFIVPVPLHYKKLKKRGYNQSEWIAKGLSEVFEKPVDTTNLTKEKENTSQTRKGVYERYENTEGVFNIKDTELFTGKHVLLVDDVLTTGSTLEACIKELSKTTNIKISVFTLAMAL